MDIKKKRYKTKTLVTLASAFVCAGVMAMAGFAFKSNDIRAVYASDSISYMAWDEDSKTVKNVEGGCTEYTVVTDSTTSWSDGWYVVDSNVTIGSRISVSGTANLILCDGFELKANDGIGLSNESSNIYIYAQSEGESAGKLTATASEDYAGIGSNVSKNGGNITINGGNISAIGGAYGAGIGSGSDYSKNGSITINGGNITATGGNSAAGIGTGYASIVGAITINGGSITATGGQFAAGIGGGDEGTVGDITISNQVTSLTARRGARNGDHKAIGRGDADSSCGTVTVCGVVGQISNSPFTAPTITYNLNDGEIQDVNVAHIYMTGAAVNLPTNLTREHFTFIGWYDNENCTGSAVTEIETTATGNKEFWAKWERITHSITYNVNGGTWNGDYATQYGEGVGLTLPTNITRNNYTFLGWYDNADLTGDAVTEIGADETENKEYWAKWIETAVYNANNLIDALPSLNDVTLDSKDAIEAARTAYDVLTSEQKTKIIHYDVLLNDEAEYFALYFLSETGSICSTGLESDDHSAALSAIWDNLKLQWDQLDSDVKDILISGTATANISDFVARYTHIMERYSDKLTPFSSGPAFVALSNKLPSSNIDSFNSAIIIISVSSIATLIVLIAIVCYKRKRLN